MCGECICLYKRFVETYKQIRIVRMGIPYLFSHLRRRYPQSVSSSNVGQNSHHHQIDELYVDFNAVVHDIASKSDGVIDDDAIICGTIAYVKNLPRSHKILLAFDGIAPLSKMRQQRARRFLHEVNNSNGNGNCWDRTKISPGTPFMKRLEVELRSHLINAEHVIISDTSQVGEGEQKIFKHINSSSRNHDTSKRVVVMGLDADLILMSLISPRWNEIELWRSNGERMIIKELRNRIENEIPIPDFVCICLLLGNDFIPALPGLRLKTSGLQEITRIYLESRPLGHKGPWIASGTGPAVAGGIRLDNLSMVITKVSKIEYGLVREADAAYHDSVYRAGMTSDEITSFIHAPGAGPGVSWIERYRYVLFGDKRPPDEIAVMYLCGLAWTFQYLGFQTVMSRGWVYPYGYAPTSFDLMNLLCEPNLKIVESMKSLFDGMDKKVLIFESMIPSWIPRTDLYMFLILPPRSLRSTFNTINVDKLLRSSAASYMYPESGMYDVLKYLKYHEWEYEPMIPEIDLEILGHSISECL